MEGLGRHRPVPLRLKYVTGCPLFTLQAPQRANFIAPHGVHAWRAIFGPPNVQAPRSRFSGSIADKIMPRVPMAVAARLPGGGHQALDLGRRQVLAGAN